MRLRLLVFAVLGVAALGAGDGIAGIPSPSNSSVDGCLVLCPSGDITFHVTVRDLVPIPIANSQVVLDLNECPGIAICPDAGPGITYDAGTRTLRKLTNGNGEAFFAAHGGGSCGGVVRVYADGVLLRSARPSSPDQDGNLIVNATDAAVLTTKLGGSDRTGDLNCDGVINSGDQSILSAHADHGCTGVVSSGHGSWGRLRTIYR